MAFYSIDLPNKSFIDHIIHLKFFILVTDERNHPFYQTRSTENIISEQQQSMLESYSSQDLEYLFMPKVKLYFNTTNSFYLIDFLIDYP